MRLAVETGIHWRAWLDDPTAMATAVEVLADLGRNVEERTNR